MRFLSACFLLSLAGLCAAPALADPPATKEEARVIAATATLDEWQQIADMAIPDRLLERAQAIAVFPSVIKGALIFGAQGGRGVVLVRDSNGRWSYPSFITLAGGSWGLQFGVQAADVILVFTTRRSIEGMSGGKLTIGADISGSAGPVGRQLSGSTDLSFSSEVYSYSRSKGLFAGIALDGSSMSIDHSANARYYTTPGLLASDVFAGKVSSVPRSAQALVASVQRLAPGAAAPGAPAPAQATAPANAPAQATPAPATPEPALESGGAATFPLAPKPPGA